MADTYYAWSDIRSGEVAQEDEKVKNVKAGEEVSASSLGISDEEFKALVESGAVRTDEFPELPEGYTGSPAEYQAEKDAAQQQIDEAQAVLDAAKETAKTETTTSKTKASEK